jgi:hypothetical protein
MELPYFIYIYYWMIVGFSKSIIISWEIGLVYKNLKRKINNITFNEWWSACTLFDINQIANLFLSKKKRKKDKNTYVINLYTHLVEKYMFQMNYLS